jgi:hypothetical protein
MLCTYIEHSFFTAIGLCSRRCVDFSVKIGFIYRKREKTWIIHNLI